MIDRYLLKKYPYIYAWAKHIGSSHHAIGHTLWEAEEDHAPPIAIYKDPTTSQWITIENLVSPATIDKLHTIVAELDLDTVTKVGQHEEESE